MANADKPESWSLFETAAKAASKRAALCGVARLFAEMRQAEEQGDLPKSASMAVRGAMDNMEVTASGLLTALRSRLGSDGYTLPSQATVQRHRKGTCSCPDLWVHE